MEKTKRTRSSLFHSPFTIHPPPMTGPAPPELSEQPISLVRFPHHPRTRRMDIPCPLRYPE